LHRPRETGGEDGHGTESDDWLCGVGRDGGESVETQRGRGETDRTEAVLNGRCTERGAGDRDGDGRARLRVGYI